MGFWKRVNKFANKTLGKKNFSMIKRLGMKTLASAIGHGIDEFTNSYGGNEKQQPDNYTEQEEPGQTNVFETKRPHNQMSKKKIISLERKAQRKANQGNFQPGKPNMNRRDEYQNNNHASNIQAVLEPFRVVPPMPQRGN
jgi:hypothetical protein